jgi:phage gp16-like protein
MRIIVFEGWKKTYTGGEDLIAIIVSLPAAALIDRLETVLEMMNRKCFERRCKDMAEARISLNAILPPSVNEKRLQNMGARDSVQDGKVLRPEIDHGHRLSVRPEDMAPETELAGVVHGHLDEGDARAG